MAALDADLQAAYAFTFPYYEMARTRHLGTSLLANPRAGRINTLGHRRTLSDHKARAVTTPNNDTLYSSAWLDLSAGPLELTIPPMANRYWSVQFMAMNTSTAAVVGSRNAGQGNTRLWITHESDSRPAPAGTRLVRLPTRDAWLLARIVVDDAQDLPAVHELQNGLQLRSVAADGPSPAMQLTPVQAVPAPLQGSPVSGENYLAVVNEMLARNPVPETEKNRLAGWSRWGLGVTAASPEQAAAFHAQLSTQLQALNVSLRHTAGLFGGGKTVQNWSYPDAAIGVFGANYALRAGVALSGLGALPPEEAIYLGRTQDDQGQNLEGSRSYRLRIPAQGIPTLAFWSLSMYQVEADGRQFFVDNPINRYAIGDRTRGLAKNADGSIDILIQHAPPANTALLGNWLPAPQGPFRLSLRAYLPTPELARGEAQLPSLVRQD